MKLLIDCDPGWLSVANSMNDGLETDAPVFLTDALMSLTCDLYAAPLPKLALLILNNTALDAVGGLPLSNLVGRVVEAEIGEHWTEEQSLGYTLPAARRFRHTKIVVWNVYEEGTSHAGTLSEILDGVPTVETSAVRRYKRGVSLQVELPAILHEWLSTRARQRGVEVDDVVWQVIQEAVERELYGS